jgi:hypothetical protein
MDLTLSLVAAHLANGRAPQRSYPIAVSAVHT